MKLKIGLHGEEVCTVAVDVVRLPYRNKLKWRQTAKSSFSADPQWTAVRVRLRRVTTDGVCSRRRQTAIGEGGGREECHCDLH